MHINNINGGKPAHLVSDVHPFDTFVDTMSGLKVVGFLTTTSMEEAPFFQSGLDLFCRNEGRRALRRKQRMVLFVILQGLVFSS